MIELTFRNRGKVSDIVYRYLDMQNLCADTHTINNLPETYFYGKNDCNCNVLFYVDYSKFCHLTTSFVNELTLFFSLDRRDAVYILFMWLMSRHNVVVRDYAINMS